MVTNKQISAKKVIPTGKPRIYSELVSLLNGNWAKEYDKKTIERMKSLDKFFGGVSKKLKTILIGGSNGKSLTIHFLSKLLLKENCTVGAFYSPHMLNYNENFCINSEFISNKVFTEIANEVFTAVESLKLKASTQEILTMIALLFFERSKVETVILEADRGGKFNPVNICKASVAVITRVFPLYKKDNQEEVSEKIRDLMGIASKDSFVLSGDQNKNNLNIMRNMTEEIGGTWLMPIRKLAPLKYPFEQIHGRCAAIAERVVRVFEEKILKKEAVIMNNGILSRPKGLRGRPTLEEKRLFESSPRKTVANFWMESASELPNRFQLFEKEKPSILLDNSRNLDSFHNLLLGIRLLSYRKPINGISLVLGASENGFDNEKLARSIRYFFKKIPGRLFICPIEIHEERNFGEYASWNISEMKKELENLKMDFKLDDSFSKSFKFASESCDERDGLVVITGSSSIVYQYWKTKNIKRF